MLKVFFRAVLLAWLKASHRNRDGIRMRTYAGSCVHTRARLVLFENLYMFESRILLQINEKFNYAFIEMTILFCIL